MEVLIIDGLKVLESLWSPKNIRVKYVTCGRPNCRCTLGYKHGPYYYVRIKVGNKYKDIYLKEAEKDDHFFIDFDYEKVGSTSILLHIEDLKDIPKIFDGCPVFIVERRIEERIKGQRKMEEMLPAPKTIDDVSYMYGLNRLLNRIDSFRIDIEWYTAEMLKGRKFSPQTAHFDKLNLYFLQRSLNQVNEACNKLWSTIELHHSVKSGDKLCKKFSENFLPSTTVPTLHYANISALISILSLFGVCSYSMRSKGIRRFYNLVRAKEGIFIMERTKYMTKIFGSAKHGWHAQILQMYRGFAEKGLELPKIDLDGSRKLQNERLRLHYDVLGQTSMREVYGIERYFEFLPVVLNSIKKAIESLHQIIEPLPNKCDERFEEIASKIDVILD